MVGRVWQNLIHKKCPDCDLKLERDIEGYRCPDDTCGFFIKPEKLAKILTDPTHAALRYASSEDKKIIDNALGEFNIKV